MAKQKKEIEPTPELIEKARVRALEGVYDGGHYRKFNFAGAYKGACFQYTACNRVAPPFMIACENMLEEQFIYNHMRLTKFWTDFVENEEINNFNTMVMKNTIEPLKNARRELNAMLEGDVCLALERQIIHAIPYNIINRNPDIGLDFNRIEEQFYTWVKPNLGKKTPQKELIKYTDAYLFTFNIWSNGFFSWYKMLIEDCGREADIVPTFLKYAEAWEDSHVFNAILAEKIAIVSKMPTRIHINEASAMHSTTGRACEWEKFSPHTDFPIYFINGRRIPTEQAEKALNGKVTREMYINEPNEEVRAAWYGYLGPEKMMDLLGAKVVDTIVTTHANGEDEMIELLKTKERLNKVLDKPYAWLKRTCPSTGTVYMTPTNADFTKAIDAAKFHRPDFIPADLPYNWISRS